MTYDRRVLIPECILLETFILNNISSCFLLCEISISDILLHLIQPCVHGIVYYLDWSSLYDRTRYLHIFSFENLHLKSLGLCMQHWYRHRWIRESSHESDSLWEARVSNVFPPILAGLGFGWKVARKRWGVAERHQGSLAGRLRRLCSTWLNYRIIWSMLI